jgi:SSS family solute:Na+ symporter
MSGINTTALVVFAFFFLLVTVMGFVAARWKAGDLSQLHEWGLAGRRFGGVITWFLLGGDFYTAYTVIAVPALVYAVGAYGFFALPYTIIVYPFVFLTMPRLWAVCHRHNFITPADFVHGRYGSELLALAVAVTGILATMPYIALQLVGMQVVIAAMGFGQNDGALMKDLPLIIAFLILALYTYTSGLRAPAMIAFVKDVMIYVMVIAAIVVIPIHLGGYAAMFDAADKAFQAKGGATGIILKPEQMVPFATLAFGSALAAFMYPHTTTGVLSSASGNVVRHNAIFLPLYTIMLGLVALMGYMAIAAGVKAPSPSLTVPMLFLAIFPDWFVGFCFAAIVIGALVPAAIMSIAAANLVTRNIWKPYINRTISPHGEATLAKLVSLVVKAGALVFIIFLPTQFAIDLQLLGGVWILQTFPAIVFGLFAPLGRLARPTGLLAGWVVGMGTGTWIAFSEGLKPVHALAFGGHTYTVYIGLTALVVNIVVSVVASVIAIAMNADRPHDVTRPSDYRATAPADTPELVR